MIFLPLSPLILAFLVFNIFWPAGRWPAGQTFSPRRVRVDRKRGPTRPARGSGWPATILNSKSKL